MSEIVAEIGGIPFINANLQPVQSINSTLSNIEINCGPDQYLKNATVNGNTLTITKKDDSLVIFQPEGGVSSVNGQTGTVILDAEDVGALPDSTSIPSKTSDLTNDSGYITNSALNGYATESWVTTSINSHHDSSKQNTLTAGTNITIENDVISATGGGSSYTAGNGITITDNAISEKMPIYKQTTQSEISYTLTDWDYNPSGYQQYSIDDETTVNEFITFLQNNNKTVQGAQLTLEVHYNEGTTQTETLTNGNDSSCYFNAGASLLLQFAVTKSNSKILVRVSTSTVSSIESIKALVQSAISTSYGVDDTTIKINDNNQLYAVGGGGGEYTAGTNIKIANNVISTKDAVDFSDIDCPIIKTGTSSSAYFQSQKFRGEGTANTYYHAADFGYAYHNQWDFYECGGQFSFYTCNNGTKSSAVRLFKIGDVEYGTTPVIILGSTKLTETQLQQLLALLPSES